jgi:hypothetical protein
MDLGHSVQLVFLGLSLHFQVFISICGNQCWVIACQQLGIYSSKLSYNDFFAKGLACAF